MIILNNIVVTILLLIGINTYSVCADQAATPIVATPQNALVLGNQLYEKGDYIGAAEKYKLALKEPQNRAFAWFNLGNCDIQIKSYQKAIVAYRRSLEEAPSFSRAWQVLGDVYFTLGAVGDAMPCYRRVLEIDGPSLHAYQMLGECALKAGDPIEALKQFDAALKQEPDQVDIYFAMAEAYTQTQDYPSAEKTMQDAILLTRNAPASAYFYLGQLYELDGNTRKALRSYEEGLSLEPKHSEYYMRIANLQEKDHAEFLSLLTLEQAIRAGVKKPEVYLKRGMIFFGQQRYDKALEEFKAAYELGSISGKTGIENVAAIYYNQGDRKKSEEVLGVLK